MGHRGAIGSSGLATLALGLLVAGCGGERQDADERSGTFEMQVTRAAFPSAQHLAQQSELAITVRNTGQEAVPQLAVTVRGFARRDALGTGDQAASDASRPVWVVDSEPAGGVTAYDNTWTAGALPAGQSRTLRWKVTPVVTGRHRLTYRVAAGLDGKAEASDGQGGVPSGARAVRIDAQPAQARVNPRTGAVERLAPRSP